MHKALVLITMTLFGGSMAHAFSTVQPTAKQQARVQSNLIGAAKRTAFYKSYTKDGGAKPRITVTFSNPATNIPGFIGSGFRQATVTIRTLTLSDTRSYNVTAGANGNFRANALGKWATSPQPIGPLVK